MEPFWDETALKTYSPNFPYSDIQTPRCTFHTDSFRPGAAKPFLYRVYIGEVAPPWLVPIDYSSLIRDEKHKQVIDFLFIKKLYRVDFSKL